jgi:small-conductance mechanosensitive channel
MSAAALPVSTPLMDPQAAMQLAAPLSQHKLDDAMWTWLLPLAAVLLASIAAAAVGRSVPLQPDNLSALPDKDKGQGWRRLLRALLQSGAFLACVVAAVFADRYLHGEPRGFRVLAQTASMVAGLWLGFGFLDALGRSLRASLHAQGRGSASAALPLMRRVLKVVWLCLVSLLYLDNLGMNVSALLAGLGVGGLAVALAGQKTMENLFGGMVLALDQPVRVGDFCRFDGKQGVVEDVGLRSIKIRTPERSLISVPNGSFSQLEIENLAVRDCLLFSTNLRLRYDSSAAQVRDVLARCEALLAANPKVDASQGRHCRLVNLGSYSMELEIFCYFATTDWDEFMLLRQDCYLGLLEAVAQAGVSLAYPTETSLQENRA